MQQIIVIKYSSLIIMQFNFNLWNFVPLYSLSGIISCGILYCGITSFLSG